MDYLVQSTSSMVRKAYHNLISIFRKNDMQFDNDRNPRVIIVLSGKRKSGKDFVAAILQKHIHNPAIIRNGGPIKSQYAKIHNLNYEEMLSDSKYKEEHRLAMVKWSTDIRKTDPSYFLRISIQDNSGEKKPIWILTDARRLVDIRFFETDYSSAHLIKLRIKASQECREKRGYSFTEGIDNTETECGLDEYNDWTQEIENEDLSEEELVANLESIIQLCQKYTTKSD